MKLKYLILVSMSLEFCYNKAWLIGEVLLEGFTEKDFDQAIKELKGDNLIEYHRGLMSEEGEAQGSGWCISYENQKEAFAIIRQYEEAPQASEQPKTKEENHE